ncbi:MAG: hypothetical protein EKK48_15385 [Candidatus Melainabacteria bacterium]|nr:MAG: hypothetical protein EKK48_15385 [Candidatus Melainabacteria bacterium]
MGTLFGQASRFLLNNDAVFLAEVLSAISPQPANISSWAGAYQSFNCLAVPANENTIPLPLSIAANVTMVLTELKIADHLIDTEKNHWKTAQKLFSKKFQQASNALEELCFPVDQLWKWFDEQGKHELSAEEFMETHFPRQLIDYCANPTAHMTAIVFESGARAVGCSDNMVLSRMHQLGNAFGKLVYVLDAFDDFARDVRRGEFNPFAVAYSIEATVLPEHCKQDIYPYVQSLAKTIENALSALILDPEQLQQFRSRLRQNISDKLGTDWLEFVRSACASHVHSCSSSVRDSARSCSNARLSMTQRYSAAVSICEHACSNQSSWFDFIIKPFVFLIAFAFPYHARLVKNRDQIFGLPFNLIAWGALVNELLAFPNQKLQFAFAMSSGSGSGSGSGSSGGGSAEGSSSSGGSADDGSAEGGSAEGGSTGGGDVPSDQHAKAEPQKWGGRRPRKFSDERISEPLPELVEVSDTKPLDVDEQKSSPEISSSQDGVVSPFISSLSYHNSSEPLHSEPLHSEPAASADSGASPDPHVENSEPPPLQNNSRRRFRRAENYRASQTPNDFFCNQCLMNCSFNMCANCCFDACESGECAGDCCDCLGMGTNGCCTGLDCCATGGDACAGADCCSGCADCGAGLDVCSGCGDCASGCGDCAGGCGDCAGGLDACSGCGDCSC